MPAGTVYIAIGTAKASVQVDELIGYCQRVQKHPGCKMCNAAQDLQMSDYRIYMEWETQEHFVAFLKSGDQGPMDQGPDTLYEAHPFKAPGLGRRQDHQWAKAERKDLTKTEGKLFFLSEDGRTRHAIFNNTSDQYDVQMRFPKQQMKPAGRNVEQDDADNTKFKVTVFPGETVPFVNGKWNGGYALSFSWGPVSDPDYLAQLAARIDAQVKEEVDAFKSFLSSKGCNWTIPGVTKTYRFQEQAAKLALQHQQQYVDLSFQPEAKNVDRAGTSQRRGWMRPQRYLPEPLKNDFELVKGTLEPADIDQGALGNCWFMAAIAACAEMPDMLIKPMFSDYNEQKTDQERKEERYRGRDSGFYRVHLAKNGWWRWHIVDTFLPVHPVDEPGAPVFAKNKEEPAEMWVAILEKTYAKLHGSYQDLAGGDPAVALSDLTGFPCQTFADWPEDRVNDKDSRHRLTPDQHKTWERLFKQVLYHDKKGRMIWVTSPGVDTSDYMGQGGDRGEDTRRMAQKYEDVGLVSGHAYTLLAAVQAEKGPRGTTRLVMIRNPWGGGKEWNRDWHDDDPQWDQYPHIKQMCIEKGRDMPGNEAYNIKGKDGTFWMDWSDVREYFDSGGVCLKHGQMREKEQWQDVRFKTAFRDGKPVHFVRLQPTADCTCLAFISQHDKRGLEPGDSRKDMCALRLDVITPSDKRSMYDTVAWSNNGVFMYAHQVLALDCRPPDNEDDFEDAFELKKGQTYYFIVRQHPDEQNTSVRNRSGIILTIQTSPGKSDMSKIRGFKAMHVNDAVTASCKYKGYYGLTDEGAELAQVARDECHDDDDDDTLIAVQLDGLDKGVDKGMLAADESNWPTKTRRW